ncbi:MAG: hypothetical protein ACK4N5_10755, partial [Myxococcales bacterium]
LDNRDNFTDQDKTNESAERSLDMEDTTTWSSCNMNAVEFRRGMLHTKHFKKVLLVREHVDPRDGKSSGVKLSAVVSWKDTATGVWSRVVMYDFVMNRDTNRATTDHL